MKDFDLTIMGLSEDEGEENEFAGIPVPEPMPTVSESELNCISLPQKSQLPAELNTLDDIRSIWLSSRSPGEIAVQARTMPFGVWMDYAIKLSPKQVKMSGQIDMRAAFVNLGPPKKNS